MGIYGGIEAGGTKFVCAVGSSPDELFDVQVIPTTTPEETLSRTAAYFKQAMTTYPLDAIGIGSFGPVDLNPLSQHYGYITSTSKPGWRFTEILGRLTRELRLHAVIDTDVNAAALGEHTWGSARGLNDFLYVTIGTGIGIGAMVSGKLLHGLQHPEMGHMFIPHNLEADPYGGLCPYHGDCLEGLASGPAIQARWGQLAENISADHPAWVIEADYLAYCASNLILMFSPQKIIFGGGVMKQANLLTMVREKTRQLLSGYNQTVEVLTNINEYIVSPGLGSRSGILGAIALAMQARQ